MTDWYYEDAGRSRGPVKEGELRTLLADGLLPSTTRIWHASFGQEWRPAREVGFVRDGGTPPPLQQAAVDRSAPPPFLDAAKPSPVAAGTIADSSYAPTYANLIAAVPLFIMVIEMVVLVAGVSPDEPAFDRGGIWWTLILSFFFAYKDAKATTVAGLNPQAKTMVPFMLLSQIGYFLRRRSVAGLSLKPLWLWLGAIVIYALWAIIAYA